MTKAVRIENADTSNYKVRIEVWDKDYPEGEPDKLAFTRDLSYPTAMTCTLHLLDIREYE